MTAATEKADMRRRDCTENANAQKIYIKTEYIKADSLIKLAALAASGGEAKSLISGGHVRVNGALCTERGKKLREGDFLEIGGIKVFPLRENGR